MPATPAGFFASSLRYIAATIVNAARLASLAEMTAPVPAGDGLRHYVRLACGVLGTHADPLEGNTRLGDIVERGWID